LPLLLDIGVVTGAKALATHVKLLLQRNGQRAAFRFY